MDDIERVIELLKKEMKDNYYSNESDTRIAQETALKLIEKEISKQALHPGYYGDSSKCPNCKKVMNYINFKLPNYCPWCGQKIYWKK